MEELQSESVVIYVLLGTSMIMLLIGGMFFFVILYKQRVLREKKKQAEIELEYQNLMIRMQLDSQEEERKRIGADLHDSLSSLLWGAKVNASYIQRTTALSDDALESYGELIRILDESINTVKRISWEISPEAFHYSGLSESVKKLCQQLDGRNFTIKFRERNNRLWNDQDALQTFRIVQELVSNACKHSMANSILVSITWEVTFVGVEVSDDGRGIDIQQNRKGVGLWNIEHRVKQLDGIFQIGNSPIGSGTIATIKIPLKHGNQ